MHVGKRGYRLGRVIWAAARTKKRTALHATTTTKLRYCYHEFDTQATRERAKARANGRWEIGRAKEYQTRIGVVTACERHPSGDPGR